MTENMQAKIKWRSESFGPRLGLKITVILKVSAGVMSLLSLPAS